MFPETKQYATFFGRQANSKQRKQTEQKKFRRKCQQIQFEKKEKNSKSFYSRNIIPSEKMK
jgi:hypothetical protein